MLGGLELNQWQERSRTRTAALKGRDIRLQHAREHEQGPGKADRLPVLREGGVVDAILTQPYCANCEATFKS
jgi:hypothetical protein